MKETGAGTNLVIGAIADGETLVRSGGDIVGSPGTPPGGSAGGDLSGTYPDPSVVAMTESSGPTSLPIGAIGEDNDVLVRSGTDIIGTHELKDISKIQGGAVASFRGMTFDSTTGSVDILHGSSPGTPAAGLHMLSLTNRADLGSNSERKIIFTSDPTSTLAYDVTNETSTASYSTDISRAAVKRSLSFGGKDALTVGDADETAVVKHKAAFGGGLETKIVLEHEAQSPGTAIDARAFLGVGKASIPGSTPYGELMTETINSSLYLGAVGNRYQRIFDDTTARFGDILDPNTGVPANWRRWTVEIAPESSTSNGIRVFEPENQGIVQAVLGISANASASPRDYNWPSTTAGGTIATHGGKDAVIGLFPYSADGNALQRDLIITAAGNQGLGTPGTFNDAIKLKNAGGIDVWGDTEFFDTVTAASFVGPIAGPLVGQLWGSVYATDGSGPVLTSPATTPGNVSINSLGASSEIGFTQNGQQTLTLDASNRLVTTKAAYIHDTPGTGEAQAIIGYSRDDAGDAALRLVSETAGTTGNAQIIRRTTADGDFEIINNGTGKMEFFTDSSLAMTIYASSDAAMQGNLVVNNGATAAGAINVGSSASTPGNKALNFVAGGGVQPIDSRIWREPGLVGDTPSYSTGEFVISHQGSTGPLKIETVPGAGAYALAGDIELHTNSTKALSVNSIQDIQSFGHNAVFCSDLPESDAATVVLSLGYDRYTDGTAHLNFYTEGHGLNPPTAAGAQIVRGPGAGGELQIHQNGTGNFEIKTNGSDALTINDAQNLFCYGEDAHLCRGIGAAGTVTIGKKLSDSSNMSIEFFADHDNDTTVSARIKRLAGMDGELQLIQVGTGSMELHTNSALALKIDNGGTTSVYGDLYVNGGLGSALVIIGNGANGVACGVEIGGARPLGGDGASYLDFTTAELEGDFNARIIRQPGADDDFEIINKGTGNMEFYNNSALAMLINLSQNVAMMGNLDIAYGTGGDAVLDIAPARPAGAVNDGNCYVRFMSEGGGVQGARIEKLAGADSDLNILQVGATNGGHLNLKTILGNFKVYTNSAIRYTVNSSGLHTFGPSNGGNIIVDPGADAGVNYTASLKLHGTGTGDGAIFDNDNDSRGWKFRNNGADALIVHNANDQSNVQAKALYVTDTATDPTAFLPAPSTAYSIINRQNTICASGKIIVDDIATTVTVSGNHFGIHAADTLNLGWQAPGAYRIYLDRKVKDDATVLVTINPRAATGGSVWSAGAVLVGGGYLETTVGVPTVDNRSVLVTIGAYTTASGGLGYPYVDFSIVVIGIMDDDP
jgi:hypothetical protein